MDQQTLILLLTIFVGLSTFAMLIQAGMLVGMFLVARKLQAKVMEFSEPVNKIIATGQSTLSKVEGHVDKIGSQTHSIMEKVGTQTDSILTQTKDQLAKVNELVQDASSRAKVQMDRAELVLDDTMNRVQTTASYIQSGVLRPVKEVHGIFTGIRTALLHLARPGRPTVDHATSDEEMFI